MKVKLLERLAGPEGNYPSGTVLTMEDKKALQLINGGYAVSLEPIPVEEHKKEHEEAVKSKEIKPKSKNKK